MTNTRTSIIAAASLAVVALVVGSLSASLSASASTVSKPSISTSSAKFVKITGTVPVGARDNVTVSLTTASGGKDIGSPGKAHRVNPTTGAFSLSVPKSTKKYTLLFREGPAQPYFDTWLGGISGENGQQSDGITSFRASANRSLGTIDILEAGVARGTVSNTEGNPIGGTIVYAFANAEQEDAWEFYGFSTKTGSYSVKMPRGSDYRLGASVRNYESTYYPSAEDLQDAATVTPDGDNGFVVTGAEIEMQGARASITGEFAKGNKAKTYEAYLYALDAEGKPISSVPVQTTDRAENSFFFWQLDAVSYGIAFRDVATGNWLPWKSYTGSKATPAAHATAANRCLLPYTGVRGPLVNVGKITLGSTSCGEPFTGAGSFSGSVTNAVQGTKVVASLFYVVPGSDGTPDDEYDSRELILVNHAVVGADGSYVLNGVSTPGTYVTKFSVPAKSAFFDSWLGGYLQGLDESQKNAIDGAPVLGESETSAGNDVALVGAAYLHGTVTRAGKKVAGALVQARQGARGIDDGMNVYEGDGYRKYVWATTTKHGTYALKIVPGLGYSVSASWSHYYGVYGPVAGSPDGTVVTATAPGAVPGVYSIAIKK